MHASSLTVRAGDVQLSVRESALASRGPVPIHTQEIVASKQGKEIWVYLPSTLPEDVPLPPNIFAEFTAVALRFVALKVEGDRVAVTYRQGTPETNSYGIIDPAFRFQESTEWKVMLDMATGRELVPPQFTHNAY